jgi:hypothetical protein
MAQTENDQQLLTASSAVRECARLGVDLSEASLKRAGDRGELPVLRTADRRAMRLFRLDDLREFARTRRA